MTESAEHVEGEERLFDELIYGAMSSVMRKIGAIGKGQTNPFDKYQFRGIDDVYNALQPALVEAGVIVVPTLQTMERTNFEAKSGATQQHVTVEVLFEFFARDGSKVTAIYPGEGQDRGDKAISKAMSGAYKAAMFGVFCIPTVDQSSDSENESPDGANIPPKPKRKAARKKAPARKPTAAEEKLGDQGETKPDKKAANPISEAQAKKAVAECIGRGEAYPGPDGKPAHGFHVLNSVLKAAGVRTARPGTTRDEVYLHICERIDRSEFDDFLALVKAWQPGAEDF